MKNTLQVDENGINKKSKSGHCGGVSTPIKSKKFKVPVKPGECADLLYTLRADRLVLEKQAEEIKANETKLKDHLIATLGKDQAAVGVIGNIATVRVVTSTIPVVTDWSAVVDYLENKEALLKIERLVSSIGDIPMPIKVATAVGKVTEEILKILSYVYELHPAMDLVQHRLNDKAVKDRWENGQNIPGVDKMNVDKVSVTKR